MLIAYRNFQTILLAGELYILKKKTQDADESLFTQVYQETVNIFKITIKIQKYLTQLKMVNLSGKAFYNKTFFKIKMRKEASFTLFAPLFNVCLNKTHGFSL